MNIKRNPSKKRSGIQKLLAPLLAVLLALFCQSISDAEIKLNLRDSFLQNQCDWAMYLDVQDLNQYLNYENSQLHPLTRVRLTYRSFPRAAKSSAQTDSTTYEEFWYFHRVPLGLKRYRQLQFEPNSLGMIVIGTASGGNDQLAALTNALIRLLIEQQFSNIATTIVLVPESSYAQVAETLKFYHFHTNLKAKEGKQMSIHLCSNSTTKEDYFYLDH